MDDEIEDSLNKLERDRYQLTSKFFGEILTVEFNEVNREILGENLKDLLKKILVVDRTKRSSPSQCLNHPYLEEMNVNFFIFNSNRLGLSENDD